MNFTLDGDSLAGMGSLARACHFHVFVSVLLLAVDFYCLNVLLCLPVLALKSKDELLGIKIKISRKFYPICKAVFHV